MWSVLKVARVSLAQGDERPDVLDVTEVHAAHAEYVWTSLYRLGVEVDDLPDMLQEVFVVVHRRAHTYDGTSKIRTWLYGICLNLVQNYRRKAHRRRERLVDHLPETTPAAEVDPEAALSRTEARQRLQTILEKLDPEKRAVLVMFEIENLSCHQIAATIGVPVGTVYSRLHAARKAFARALTKT
jgi:RNA polymerase sigma-70 factor (ECF subfamily)